MSRDRSIAHRIAHRITQHAAKVLPHRRSVWARAMLSEIDHLPSRAGALRWAFGCVVASYFERIGSMEFGTASISRPVLALEMLLCFGVLTMMFGGLLTVDVLIVPRPDWFFFLSMTIVGPVGLIAAFRFVVLDRRSLSRVHVTALLMSAIWTLVAYSAFLLAKGNAAGGWRELVLLAGLPFLGALHLLYITSSRGKAAAPA